jgi:nucleolar protein 9
VVAAAHHERREVKKVSQSMVSIGSKALPRRRRSSMGRECKKSKKPKKGSSTHEYDTPTAFDNNNNNSYSSSSSRIRKQVDPETTKYLSQIANLFESDGVALEERSLICANALEETKGKEFEIATDYILSHTLETILQGCDVDNLCAFLHSSANQFPFIAMDRSGSHVAQTAINSLASHLQYDDQHTHSLVEEALTLICNVIAANSLDVMCNCYGSHVLRTLLCLCKGVPLDKSGFYLSKSTTALAERLNFKQFSSNKDAFHSGFPILLNSLVSQMFNHATKYIKSLQLDQFSSLVFQVWYSIHVVDHIILLRQNISNFILTLFTFNNEWQTTLRVLAGNDELLLDVIPILLGCKNKNNAEGNLIETAVVPELKNLFKEPGFSHLMEV